MSEFYTVLVSVVTFLLGSILVIQIRTIKRIEKTLDAQKYVREEQEQIAHLQRETSQLQGYTNRQQQKRTFTNPGSGLN